MGHSTLPELVSGVKTTEECDRKALVNGTVMVWYQESAEGRIVRRQGQDKGGVQYNSIKHNSAKQLEGGSLGPKSTLNGLREAPGIPDGALETILIQDRVHEKHAPKLKSSLRARLRGMNRR